MNSLSSSWQRVHDRIAAACQASGRSTGSVHLLAVSKTFPADQVAAVAALDGAPDPSMMVNPEILQRR